MKILAITFFAVLAALPIQAGMPSSSCQSIDLFSDAKVNVIVLPYRNKDVSNADLERTGSQLTLLLQESILFSALKYSSIGTIRAVVTNPARASECDAGPVAQRILPQLKNGNAAILLWGQIYKEGDQIYICSYARLLQKGDDTAMRAAIQPSLTNANALVANLLALGLTFPPRVMTTAMLAQITASFNRAAQVHRDKNMGSPSFALPLAPEAGYSYSVVEAASDGWMRIQGSRGGPSGWINVAGDQSAENLMTKMPELRFIDGAIGFFEGDAGSKQASAQASLATFTQTGVNDETALTAATAKAMLAAMLGRNAETRARGYKFAREAVALAPYNADARNLELVYRIAMGGTLPFQRGNWRPIADEFAQAAALGPGKKYILENLLMFYSRVQASPNLGDEADSLVARRNQAGQILVSSPGSQLTR